MVVRGDGFDGVWTTMDLIRREMLDAQNQIATAAAVPNKGTMTYLMHNDDVLKNDNEHGHGARVFTFYEDRQRDKSIRTLSIYIGIHNFFQ